MYEISTQMTGTFLVVPSGVISHMAGWKIPELNGGVYLGKSLISMVHGFQAAMFDDAGV